MKSKLVSSKNFIELARKLTDIQELTPEILHTLKRSRTKPQARKFKISTFTLLM